MVSWQLFMKFQQLLVEQTSGKPGAHLMSNHQPKALLLLSNLQHTSQKRSNQDL